VKYRFFVHLLGGDDPQAEQVYRWHIEERSGPRMKAGLTTDKWKQTLDDYVEAAKLLIVSMMHQGFSPYYAVPVDPAGELLDGAHRVACAVALGIKEIDVERHARRVWAPAWDAEWFKAHGVADFDRLMADWERMKQ
jgi:hypothetical protein